MPTWVSYRKLIDDILGRTSHRWGSKTEHVIQELFPPSMYAYIPKSFVTYVSDRRYAIKVNGPWNVPVRLVNSHFEVIPNETDHVSCMVCAKHPDRYGVPLHMVATMAKSWSNLRGSKVRECTNDQNDDNEVLFDTLNLCTPETKQSAVSLFDDYGLAANLLLNKFTFEEFVVWETNHAKKYRKCHEHRSKTEYVHMSSVWAGWSVLTNVEKHVVEFQRTFGMDDNDESLFLVRNILELNPSSASTIIELIRLDPFCLHDILPRTFGINRCMLVASKLGMKIDHPYHVVRLIKRVILENESEGHAFADLKKASEFWGDRDSACHNMAMKILNGEWNASADYMGPIYIHMPSKLSKKESAGEDSSTQDVSSKTVKRVIGSIRGEFYVDRSGSYPRVYRSIVWEAQTSYLQFIREFICEKPIPYPPTIIDHAIDQFEEREGIKLTNEQRTAVVSAVENPLTLIIGEAGSGKTTVLKSILDVLVSLRLRTPGVGDVGKNVLCVAPTGKAARVFNAKTGWNASTIDSLIVRLDNAESVYDFIGVSKHEEPSWSPIVVVDEMSMVTLRHTSVFNKLANMVATQTDNDGANKGCRIDRLIMLGDSSQLPPIGAGDVFHDTVQIIKTQTKNIVECHTTCLDKSGSTTKGYIGAKTICLTGSKRIDPKSASIYTNARLLRTDRKRKGVEDTETVNPFELVHITAFVKEKDVFEIVETTTNEIDDDIIKQATIILKKEKEVGWGRKPPTPFHTLQILTDTNAKREVINKNIQNLVQSMRGTESLELSKNERAFVGDKVMVCDNAIEMGVVNGDIGWIVSIPRRNQASLILEGDDNRRVIVDINKVRVTLAYAITVHKAQGSEFPFILCVFYKKFRHTTRALVYTAITRGRKRVRVMSSQNAFETAINTKPAERMSDAYRCYFNV